MWAQDGGVRFGVFAALCVIAPAAEADPRLEASGFVGIGYFGDNIELGNSWAPEQVPGTSPVVGARLGYLAVPALGDPRVQLAVEAELAIAPAFTSGSYDGGRMSYFAPVFGWRAQGVLRFTRWAAATPLFVVGFGGETVASSSPFMSKETDPEVYYGPGVTIPVSTSSWLRIDVRHGVMPARDGGATSTLEVQFGVGTRFGLATRHAAQRVVEAPPVVDERDLDGDGLPDRLDACPEDKETVNGVDDSDGCPEADPDSDGVIGLADKCPIQAEDFDHFQDDDGCPDLDNDADGISDQLDACPSEPETANGFEDADGCPDQVPAEITAALAVNVKFEPTRARVTEAAKRVLQPVLAMLRAHPELAITVAGHPDKAGEVGADLAKRRAEAVKWFLVDQGIEQARITTSVGTVGRAPIELALQPHQ